jgi:hypothetical protein
MKPFEETGCKPMRVNDCERTRDELHEASDARRAPAPSEHVASCTACTGEVALLKELDALLASEPPVLPPPELVPAVMALVRADLARAKLRARLALAGAVAAIVAFAYGLTFFDVVSGATGLVADARSWVQAGLELAPRAPELPSIELPAVGYAWAALAVGAVILAAEARLLATAFNRSKTGTAA